MVVATTSQLVLSLFSFVNLKHTIMFTSAFFLFPEDPNPTLLHHFQVPNGLTASVFSSLLLPSPGPDFQMCWACLLFGTLYPYPYLLCSPGEFILSFLASSVTFMGKLSPFYSLTALVCSLLTLCGPTGHFTPADIPDFPLRPASSATTACNLPVSVISPQLANHYLFFIS